VQVHYDEGVATHIDPEPCAHVREGLGEASVGERIGQPLSRERKSQPRMPTPCRWRKAIRRAAYERLCPSDPAWSKTLACAEAPCAGTGRSHAWPMGECPPGPHREGEEP
jgi:hypothetical protein